MSIKRAFPIRRSNYNELAIIFCRFVIITFFFSIGTIVSLKGQAPSTLKIAQLFEWVDNYYVDTVDMTKLCDDVIRKTLQELDPHSVYITKEEVRSMNEPLEGLFEGIGVSFNILNDTIMVMSAISGGPSEKIGVRSGDKIITIDGRNVAGTGIKTNDIYKVLRGKKGTEVSIGIKRKGEKELLEFHIIRDKIPIYSIDATYMVNNNTGYIRLSRFAASSKKEFDQSLNKLYGYGAKNLILDLTGNGGGYIDVAVKLADEFFEKGQLIVYTEGDRNQRRNYVATSRGSFKKGKLVVMIDESSASASEILAGAIQDWDRGVIVGRRSFGKGLVQRQMVFADSSMIRLTIARYHTPTGRMIQKTYNSQTDEYSKGLYSRLKKGELTDVHKNEFADSLKYETLVKKRTVYGGGGIMPDIFIPIDTSFNNTYYRQLWGKGIFNRFILNYIDMHRNELEHKYASFEVFDTSFEVTDTMLEALRSFAGKEGLEDNEILFTQAKTHMSLWFKAYVARGLWGIQELYRVSNREDPIFLKAVAEMELSE